MSVNGITSSQATAAYQASTTVAKKNTATKESTVAKESAVEKETASSASKASTTGVIYEPDTNLINKLKADAEARTSQLRSLVEQMMGTQTNKFGQANDIWKFLSKGNYTVDAATKAQAQADISENGYWGVNQTSDRIIQFATALTGGDPDKIDEMRSAFEKGYKQAEKTWGGSLPDISKRTYDAVLQKFDELAANAKTNITEE